MLKRQLKGMFYDNHYKNSELQNGLTGNILSFVEIFFYINCNWLNMIGLYIISGITLLALFVLFLVLSNILNNIINQLLKLEYMFQKEYEFNIERKETLEMLT
jgi:hypothetical protein